MEEIILNKASDLFLNFGFKSVTMDDIANALGMSKKTIYVHFPNKTKLVERAVLHVFDKISHGIDCICALNKNPIEEIYHIKNLIKDHLKDEKSSPQYQLQKYYPRIYNTLKRKQFELMSDSVKDNLNRGMARGLYRTNLNLEFISRLYFSTMVSLKDDDVFSKNLFTMDELMENFLEYHIRGICTEKGQDKLNDILKTL